MFEKKKKLHNNSATFSICFGFFFFKSPNKVSGHRSQLCSVSSSLLLPRPPLLLSDRGEGWGSYQAGPAQAPPSYLTAASRERLRLPRISATTTAPRE